MESMWSKAVVEDELIDKINEIKEQFIVPIEDIWRALARVNRIFIVNQEILSEFDMDDFCVDMFFVPNKDIEKERILEITNEDIDMKTELYKYCSKNPDKIKQGTKKYDFSLDNEE